MDLIQNANGPGVDLRPKERNHVEGRGPLVRAFRAGERELQFGLWIGLCHARGDGSNYFWRERLRGHGCARAVRFNHATSEQLSPPRFIVGLQLETGDVEVSREPETHLPFA